jgi:hypothetical protein
VRSIASQFTHHRQIARDHRHPGGHPFENLQRAAALHHIAIVQRQRRQHRIAIAQPLE